MIVYVDMDGVLANFDKALKSPREPGKGLPPEMLEKDFFRNLEVMPGAIKAIDELESLPGVEVFIATKITTKNLYSATEKFEWIEEHFPSLLKKIFITCDKALLKGDFLIDDYHRWKTFPGTFIHFNKHNPIEAWSDAVQQIKDAIGS